MVSHPGPPKRLDRLWELFQYLGVGDGTWAEKQAATKHFASLPVARAMPAFLAQEVEDFLGAERPPLVR